MLEIKNLNASINGDILTILFDSNYNGESEVEIEVSDGEFSDSDSFIITVLPVNDPPIVENPLTDLSLSEDFGEFFISNLNNIVISNYALKIFCYRKFI